MLASTGFASKDSPALPGALARAAVPPGALSAGASPPQDGS